MTDNIENDFIEADFPSGQMNTGNNSATFPGNNGGVANPFSDSNGTDADVFTLGRGTLDENIMDTLKRDLFDINFRLKQVVYPHIPTRTFFTQLSTNFNSNGSNTANESEDPSVNIASHCDLWAPLAFVIIYSLCVSHARTIFSSVFMASWFILLIMGLHLRVTQPFAKVSLISYISLSGYCLFPQVISALCNQILLPLLIHTSKNNEWVIRLATLLKLFILFGCVMWSVTSIALVTRSSGFIQIFPLGLCLLGMGWLAISL